MKKLLLLSALLIFACTDDEGNPCIYQPTLTTEAVTNITETSATLNGTIDITSENCETPNNTEQGFVYSTEIQPTTDDIQVNVNGTNISTTIEGLEPNTTYYVRSFVLNNFGEFYGDEIEFTTTYTPCDVVYLDDNGVTVKACPNSDVGDVGTVNGIEYTIVDREVLDLMIENEEDVTKVCTSKITNMEALLYTGSYDEPSTFNQDISTWDVSNVTNMKWMFTWCGDFNQNISHWDVGSVTNMYGMFIGAMSFNQPIGEWDMSSVEDIRAMFNVSHSFNQPIGNWDVSNVSDLTHLFQSAYSFNQDIGSWDVSNVTTMDDMFFAAASFNQDISNWDVSNVTFMISMFFGATSFNQNLSNWSVENVTNCATFSSGATAWIQPQPNFTNCNPN